MGISLLQLSCSVGTRIKSSEGQTKIPCVLLTGPHNHHPYSLQPNHRHTQERDRERQSNPCPFKALKPPVSRASLIWCEPSFLLCFFFFPFVSPSWKRNKTSRAVSPWRNRRNHKSSLEDRDRTKVPEANICLENAGTERLMQIF